MIFGFIIVLLFHFGYILLDLGFESREVVCDDRNHLFFIHYIITVNNEVTHTDNITPRGLSMCITKLARQQIGGLSNNN